MERAGKGPGVFFQSRRARTALLAMALFLLSVTAHAFFAPCLVDRLDAATVSHLPEDYSLRLAGDDLLLQPFVLSRDVARTALHIAAFPEGQAGSVGLRILDARGEDTLAEAVFPAAELFETADLKVEHPLPPGEYLLELRCEGLGAPLEILSRSAEETGRPGVLNGETLSRQAAFTGEYPAARYPFSLTAAVLAVLVMAWFLLARRRTSLRICLFALALSAGTAGCLHLLGLPRNVRQGIFYLLLAGIWLLGPWLLGRKPFLRFLSRSLSLFRRHGRTAPVLILGAAAGALAEWIVSSRLGQPFLWGRGGAFAAAGALLALFIFRGKRLFRSPEKSFAAAALILGVYLAAALPPVTIISWDDQIHFDRTVAFSQGVYAMTSEAERGLANVEFHCSFSQRENREICAGMDEMQRSEQRTLTYSRKNILPDRIGYLPLAAGRWLGEMLDLPFSLTFHLGRMTDVAFFVGMLCLAMGRMKGGKLALAALGLLPTVLFLAATYSYDPWTIAFLAVGFAEFFALLQSPERTLTPAAAVRMVGCIVLGCLPKGIYGLMLPVLLILPRDRFASPRDRKRFCALVLAATAAMLVYSAVPQIIDVLLHSGGGDRRGGDDVNTLAQLRCILAHPMAYAGVVLRFLKEYLAPANAFEFTSSMAYLWKVETAGWLLLPFVAAAALDRSGSAFALDRRPLRRLAGLGLVLVQIVAVVTVFYLVFTPVGAQSVAGCQNRYLLPALFPAGMIALHTGGREWIPAPVRTAAVTLAGSVGAGWCIWALVASRFVP